MQKCPPTQAEETFLAKCFKFFDIHNKGEVNFDQFFRTVEKIGVIIDKNVLPSLTNICVGLLEDIYPVRLERERADGLQGVCRFVLWGR